ncbi:hypothetical protein ebA4042 [Aromatoleum aromaticum EbN1]|uniref:Uncharacterized protein n=1 Tax=Aromatoleum aromaticum (strain DSM 19018 / LMG 30748 / EbN1) TaxID=76114 RepID=Q5P2P7_AROAE|nr:hypothetical protein ebA4042 [Aromatoleum aromaticum EbN1]
MPFRALAGPWHNIRLSPTAVNPSSFHSSGNGAVTTTPRPRRPQGYRLDRRDRFRFCNLESSSP